MELREIENKNEWERFAVAAEPHTFLQSWNWGEFHRAMGDAIWRLGIYDGGELAAIALVIKVAARRGTFLFCPHGPLVHEAYAHHKQYGTVLKELVTHLRERAMRERCAFIRVSPIVFRAWENEALFKELGFRQAPMHMHAERMWLLDLAPDEKTLLKGMRKTTRYLIKKAQSDDVEIVQKNDAAHVDAFSDIYRATAERQHFTAFSKKYLEKEFEAFREDHQTSIFLARYHGEYVSGALIVFYGNAAFYHQGASLMKYPKVPAPHLLQWEAIQEAKRRGMRYYNFWGISPDNKPKHPWAGLSLFKKGFGGFSEEYMPAQDLVLKQSYWLTFMIEKSRKLRRKL